MAPNQANNSIRSVSCEFCGTTRSCAKDLLRHIRAAHSSSNYSFTFRKSFTRKDNYIRHLRTCKVKHDKGPFLCICGKKHGISDKHLAHIQDCRVWRPDRSSLGRIVTTTAPIPKPPDVATAAPVAERAESSNSKVKQACWECQRRRVVCDSARPVCPQCRLQGIVCPGYDNVKPLTWLAPDRITMRKRKTKQPNTSHSQSSIPSSRRPTYPQISLLPLTHPVPCFKVPRTISKDNTASESERSARLMSDFGQARRYIRQEPQLSNATVATISDGRPTAPSIPPRSQVPPLPSDSSKNRPFAMNSPKGMADFDPLSFVDHLLGQGQRPQLRL
ncbi:hypothetical protein GCG54_00009082 [Colletotrichum gloeosporioides]|uniref:Zn(2)-C6 fungal-type domain-containing protein n=1 Tax=Colletotrichum gloeosporioides TaxID=474922 RepID=A0A8H8WNJ6_COLGL|nr:uncharacterized protein GCG54_00009082 [Colletotrichum gloeosporioides]KAF3797112.1 hypothetical protein GCG54_00009082 [Colletotrichum gloeosporioides]